jgi:hypothetical protein
MIKDGEKTEFKPKGAIAFFAVMIAFYFFLWFVFYFLMLGRR